MRRIPGNAVLLYLLLLAQGASAAVPNAGEASLDEVVVEGKRQLSELRDQIVALEERFYQRYNELNLNHDFDVRCFQDAPTGTRLKRRSCRVAYQEDALMTAGQEALAFLQHLDVPGGPPPPEPASMAIQSGQKDFQTNLVETIRRNPELVGLLLEHARLAKDYEAVRRRAFGLKPEKEKTAPAASGAQ